jgi:hypothetical protein
MEMFEGAALALAALEVGLDREPSADDLREES